MNLWNGCRVTIGLAIMAMASACAVAPGTVDEEDDATSSPTSVATSSVYERQTVPGDEGLGAASILPQMQSERMQGQVTGTAVRGPFPEPWTTRTDPSR
jgi:hypothetical protein